jgi:hypothetical protein
MLLYKDIEDRTRIRRTFGKPIGIRRDGPLNAWGLVLQLKRSELFIPEYLLTGASRAYYLDFKAREVHA